MAHTRHLYEYRSHHHQHFVLDVVRSIVALFRCFTVISYLLFPLFFTTSHVARRLCVLLACQVCVPLRWLPLCSSIIVKQFATWCEIFIVLCVAVVLILDCHSYFACLSVCVCNGSYVFIINFYYHYNSTYFSFSCLLLQKIYIQMVVLLCDCIPFPSCLSFK